MDSQSIQKFFTRPKPEKTVIVLDTSNDFNMVEPVNYGGSNYKRFTHVIRAIEIFIRCKHEVNSNHEFSLYMLDQEPQEMIPFTNQPNTIYEILRQLQPFSTAKKCDLSPLFSSLEEELKIQYEGRLSYNLHILIIYARMNTQPTISQHRLLSHPDTHIDVLYFHSPFYTPQEQNIHGILGSLDKKKTSISLGIGEDATQIYQVFNSVSIHVQQRLNANKYAELNSSFQLHPLV